MSQFYEELLVYDGIAEMTGNRVDRAGVRGRQGVCRSLSALGAKWRRLGDGYYYLDSAAWPADSVRCELKRDLGSFGL